MYYTLPVFIFSFFLSAVVAAESKCVNITAEISYFPEASQPSYKVPDLVPENAECSKEEDGSQFLLRYSWKKQNGNQVLKRMLNLTVVFDSSTGQRIIQRAEYMNEIRPNREERVEGKLRSSVDITTLPRTLTLNSTLIAEAP